MHFLLIFPKSYPVEGCTDLPVCGDTHYSRLVRYEDELGKLLHSVVRLYSNIKSKCLKAGLVPVSVKDAIKSFKWQEAISPDVTLEHAIESLHTQYKGLFISLEQAITKCADTITPEAPPQAVLERMLPNRDLAFIDCIVVSLGKNEEKAFREDMKKTVSNELVDRIYTAENNAFYAVYCLKKDTPKILSHVTSKYNCVKELDNSNGEEHADLPASDCRDDGEYKIALMQISADSASLYVRTAFILAYVESLHRYGAPTEYKYVLRELSEREINKERRSAKHTLLKAGVIEDGSDSQDQAFTELIIGDDI